MRNTVQKITLQLQILASYVPVNPFQCLTALGQAYFPLFNLHRKSVRAHSGIIIIIPDELHLFEQKEELKILTIFNKKLSLLILTILVLLCINAIKNVLFSLQTLVQSAMPNFSLQIDIDLSLQFDISFTVVLNVALTVYPQMKFMLLAGCSNIQIACDA